ncbi:MAG: murein biosynthesis integral membrane protein MurJ [Gammaproteobacteria bacterium]|nr:murein biosynthesis integral membrane protein MurJ [Gammaproteobacteria bacterium]
MSRKLIKSTLLIGAITLISRIAGLVRDMTFAHLIGAGSGVAADAFYVAFRVPNFLRRIFGEGAFSQAFVPVFSEYKTRNDADATRMFVDHVAGLLAAVLLVVAVIGVLAAPLLVTVLAPGFLAVPEKFQLTVQMLRITFPYILFISLVSMSAGILNTYGRFAVPAFTPVLLNLSLIGAALLLAPHMHIPVIALAWGVAIAGVAQLLFQLPFLMRLRLLPRPKPALHDEGVRRVFRLMAPGIFGVSVSQINLLIDTLLASFLVTGSVSWLYYSDRLMEFPVGVFGIALGTVILPSLSVKHVRASHEAFSHTLDWAIRLVLLVGFPATVGLIILRGPMLATLFRYGAFGAHDVIMASRSLMAFAFGLTGFLLIRVLAPGYYARQDTKTPVRIGVVALVSNMVLSLSLIYPLAHAGLALATSLSAYINAGLLLRGLVRQKVYRPGPGFGGYAARLAVASLVMGVVLWWGAGALSGWLHDRALERAGRLAIWVVAGMLVYAGMLLLLGIRPRQLVLQKADGDE